MKRTTKVVSLALILVVALIATMVGVTAATTTTAVVYGDVVNLSGNTGSTFDVGFHFKNNDIDVEAGKINLSWDASKVSATSIVAAGVLAEDGVSFTKSIDNENGTATVAWAGSKVASSVAEGKLFEMTFDKTNLDEEGSVTVDIEVEAFGYTALFIPYNLASSVTANSAFASSAEEIIINDGDDVVAKLEMALDMAKVMESVPVTLNTTWTLTEDVTIGDVDKIPAGKIVVTGTGGITTGGFIAHLAGHFEFGEITFTGNGANTSNALFAVDGAEIIINNTIRTSTTATQQINVVGSKLTIHGGNYQYVAGNINGTDYGISGSDIHVDGSTKLYYFVGGSYNKGAVDSMSGKTNGYIGGSASVTGYCIGGSWYAKNTNHGGTLTINTTGTIAQAVAGYSGEGIEACKGDDYKYTLNIENGVFSSHVCSGIFVADSSQTAYYNTEFNISGGRFTGDVYGGITHGWSTVRKYSADGVSVLNITGGDFSKSIFGGSDICKAGGTFTADSTINISDCTIDVSVFGGADISVANMSNNGTVTATFSNAIIHGEVYGGSYVNANGASENSSITLNLKNGTKVCHPNYDANHTDNKKLGYSVYGGSKLGKPNTAHNGNIDFNMYVDADKTSTYTYSFIASSTVYGGSNMVTSGDFDASNSRHTGMIDVDVDKAWFDTVYGPWAALTLGSYINASGAEVVIESTDSKRGIELEITNSKIDTRVLGGGYIGGKGGRIEADTLVTVGSGNTISNSMYGGAYIGASSARFVGNSKLVFDMNTSSASVMMFGGSYVGVSGAEHVGNSEIEVLSGSLSNTLMGGSHLIVCGAVHRGNSYIVTSGTMTANNYGGSYLCEAGTKHIGNSELKMLGGSTTKYLVGGSMFPTADGSNYVAATHGEWGHLGGSGVVVESGTVTGGFIFAGSNMNVDAASIQTGHGVHGVRYQAATADTEEVKASETYVTISGGTITSNAVYGGSYVGRAGTMMNGNYTVTISGGTLNLKERIACGYAVNGTASNPNEVHGNCSVTITGTADINSRTVDGTAYYPSIMGGLYGTALVYGDTSLEISGNANIIGSKIDSGDIIAGNWGSNIIDSSTTGVNHNNPYGGIRQTGNVTFTVSGSPIIGERISVIGYRNNITGDVTVDISGSPRFMNNFYGNFRGSNQTNSMHGSCEGDMRYYIAGTPTFDVNFWAVGTASSAPHGPANGVNVCKGVCYIEVSGAVTVKSGRFYGGTFGASGGTVIKLVGNADFNMVAANTYVWFHQYKAGYIASGTPSFRLLDLTQYTGALTAKGLPDYIAEDPCRNNDEASGYTFTVYEPLNGKNVTFGTNELTAGTEMTSLVNGKNVTIGNTTVSYADLTRFDSISRSPNAFKFYSAEQNKEIKKAGAATHDIYVMSGPAKSATMHFENTALEATVEAVKNDFGFVGNSIRTTGSLALRCRAYITQSFLNNHLDLANGFKIKEVGILVSAQDVYATTELLLGASGTVTAVAWKDGEKGENMFGGWMTDDVKYPGCNLFSAAISNYTEALYARNVYFRPYVICEDANGDTFVTYRDLSEYVTEENTKSTETDDGITTTTTTSGSALISGNGFTQYTASLYKRANYEKEANTDFYGKNTATINDIIDKAKAYLS